MPNQEELVENIIQSLEQLDRDHPASNKLASYLYVVDKKLPEYLEKFKKYLAISKPSQKERQDAGYLLEIIVYLIFRGLQGATTFKSFQSPSSQYDLLVTGENPHWHSIIKFLYMTIEKRGIIIEAKARKDKVNDQAFARLCSIMDHNLTNYGLGIFVTLKGATGFPKRNATTRQRCIRDCRLRQALYHAKTEKYLIVLDQEDIFSLDKNGTLMNMLIRKIRDVKELSGIPIEPVDNFKEIDLPPHLKEILDN